jgi:hypothetical protein
MQVQDANMCYKIDAGARAVLFFKSSSRLFIDLEQI